MMASINTSAFKVTLSVGSVYAALTMQQLVVAGLLFHITKTFRSALETWQFVPAAQFQVSPVEAQTLVKVALFAKL